MDLVAVIYNITNFVFSNEIIKPRLLKKKELQQTPLDPHLDPDLRTIAGEVATERRLGLLSPSSRCSNFGVSARLQTETFVVHTNVVALSTGFS